MPAPSPSPAQYSVSRGAGRLDWWTVLLAAIGGAGALLVLLQEIPYGPGLTADSARYVSAARNLLDGNGLVTFLGAPYRDGPLFPLILAGAGLVGADPVTAAGSINAAIFGLTVYAAAVWARSRVRVPLVAVWAGCACVLSTSLAGAAAHVWPEAPFILLAVVSLCMLDRRLRAGGRRPLVLAAAAAAAAALTHYAGAALIAAGALLLLAQRTAAWRRRLAAAAVWCGLAAAPVGAWLAGTFVLGGASFATAGPGGFLPLESLHAATVEVVGWLIGRTGLGLLDRVAAGSQAAAGLRTAVLLIAAAGVGYALARRRSRFLRDNHAVPVIPGGSVPLVFCAAYALYLLVVIPAGGAVLQIRHLTPLFPPLLITAASILDELVRRARPAVRGRWVRPLAAALLAALWLVPQAEATAAQVERRRVSGIGYAAPQWRQSDLVRYLNAHRPRTATYGTDPAALYFLTSAAESGAYALPREQSQAWARLAAEETAGREHRVVWFYRDSRRYRYGPDTLLRMPGMEVVAVLDDGAILGRSPPPLLQDVSIGLRSGFTVYLDAAAERLIYTKADCSDADLRTRFFLHVLPAHDRDLPESGHRHHNLNFNFVDHGFRHRGLCVAGRALPGFPVARIETGQYTPRDGQLWWVTLEEPAARRDFAVHLLGDKLIYRKEPCAATDAQAKFFLHVTPADDADLPAQRRERGFDSLDFDLHDRGLAADGRCRAVAPLPAYAIAGIRTGQYGAAGEPRWTAEFAASRTPPVPPELTVAKWFDDRTAAISITYDGVPARPNRVDDLALEMGLALDYEMVTQRYLDRLPAWVEHDLTELIPDPVPGDLYPPLTDEQIAYGLSLTAHGFGFFGHGHWHVDHDVLTYAQAYESFRLTFEVMESLGVKPVAYAYPRGAGVEAETHQALADAGFLAGRLSIVRHGQTPYIVPDAATTPDNWFFLPGLTMESIDFRQCGWCINDTRELAPILDQTLRRTAWIIPVYHNIGGRARNSWGFYDWEDFQTDLRAIAARDFWIAPMNDVVLYLRERESAAIAMQVTEQDGVTGRIEFVLADGLDNDRFDQPLTLLFRPPADWFDLPVEVTQHGRVVGRVPAFAATATLSLLPNEEPYLAQPSPAPRRAGVRR